jgi:hypothetical protein
MQSPFYMKTHYIHSLTPNHVLRGGHKFGGWASRAARDASRQGDARAQVTTGAAHIAGDEKKIKRRVLMLMCNRCSSSLCVPSLARAVLHRENGREGEILSRGAAAKRESGAVRWLLLNYDPLGTKRIMQVADNFFAALFAGTPGLDGRDGIPGEPGLDGIPGEFLTHI